jgi:hypothetical protein
VDGAAAELLVHVGFSGQLEVRNSQGNLVDGGVGSYIGQRLLHFAPVRDEPGADVSAVSIADSGPGRDFDFSQVLGPRLPSGLPQSEMTATGFDAATGRTFDAKQHQLALARVVDDSNDAQLQVDLYAAKVRLEAGFTFDTVEANGPFPARFTSTATGDIAARHWNFGDGASSVAENPSHNYNATGNYAVTLTVTDSNGKQSSYSTMVQINGLASSGGQPARYSYTMDTTPRYSAATETLFDSPVPGTLIITRNNFNNSSLPRIAIGDMDRDGLSEIMTSAQTVVSEETNNNFNTQKYPRHHLAFAVATGLWPGSRRVLAPPCAAGHRINRVSRFAAWLALRDFLAAGQRLRWRLRVRHPRRAVRRGVRAAVAQSGMDAAVLLGSAIRIAGQWLHVGLVRQPAVLGFGHREPFRQFHPGTVCRPMSVFPPVPPTRSRSTSVRR